MAVQTSESPMPKREAVTVAFKDIPRRDGIQKRLILKYEPESKVYTYVMHLNLETSQMGMMFWHSSMYIL